ncbi:hypothetical protein SAMN02745121_04996 [Nannocystis exedens]|uniref:Uncharacterized protein n=1 Tax=Nannocystis exedens TaxID=54 RepID=A0A1I2C9W4_9BACT|nr:hypothetical protein [Nannocystis exedens]PCC68434.1 hypothetical protein NAEX_01448 [Nannocystis exedens]SFE65129.1 hypothetical protein SAMN02745121_04996 [Nannocystis exedens]
MRRSPALSRCLGSALWLLSLGACEKSATTAPEAAGGTGPSSAAPTGKPAPKGSYAALAGEFEEAAARPAGAGKPELERLTGPLLDAASRRLSELSIVHEVERGDKVAALWISAESGSPLGRLSEQLRSGGDTRMVYDLGYFRDHPGRPAGYDAAANVLRIEHAVIQRGGDPDEPRLRHEQARAEVWGLLRRGEPSPYHFRLLAGSGADEVVRGDEVHALARDLVRELQGVQDLLISPDDAPVTQADLAAALATSEGTPAPRPPSTELEIRFARLSAAAVRGAGDTAKLQPQLKQAQSKARGKNAAQASQAPRGASLLLQLDPVKGDPSGVAHALIVDLAESTGPEDPKNAALLRTRLTDITKAVDRHAAHFAAMVELLRRIAGTPSGSERRALFKALAAVIEPVAEDAPAKAKAQAAYVKRFDEALVGPAPAK